MSRIKKKKGISVVINTYNEEKNIKECISCLIWADEIIIADMHSNDRTINIAKEYTSKIFFSKKYQYVEPARNFAISKTTKNWILIIDADEIFSDNKGSKIRKLIHNNEVDGYLFSRRAYINNDYYLKHGYFYPDYQLRLFKNNGNIKYSGKIHEQPVIPKNKTKIINEIEIYHNPSHSKYDSILHFYRFFSYIRIEGEEMSRKKVSSFQLMYLIPLDFLRHVYRSFIKLHGYKDGYPGFRAAVIYALYKSSIYGYAFWVRIRDKIL